MKKYFFAISLLIAFIFLFCGISNATPQPRGRVYEVTAKVLSVKQGAGSRYFDVQKNANAISSSADIEIEKIGHLVKESEYLKGTESRDKYSVGQKIHVLLLNADNVTAGSSVKGNIFSHGDETGDWYDFEVVTK